MLSRVNICKQLNITKSMFAFLEKFYDLKRDNSEVRVKRVIQSNIETKSKHIDFDLEKLRKVYIDNDLAYEEVKTMFNLTGYQLDKILRENGWKKPRKQSSKKVISTKLEKYGSDNYGNWQKGHETRIKNYGSLEASYNSGMETYRQTCLERYGYETPFVSPEIKSHRKKKETKPNIKFRNLLDALHIDYQQEFVIHTKSYDFRVGTILIEINPTVTHNSTYNIHKEQPPMPKDYHLVKSSLAKENGYHCVHVFDWDDKYKVVDMLKYKTTIFARKCELKELNKSITKQFLDENHLQGSCRGQTHRYGLFYNNELVQVMTFGKPRYNKNYEYELLRLCTKRGYSITGGSNKLFKYFVDNVKPNSVISYCDIAKHSGNVYERLGFKLLSISKPTRHWYSDRLSLHITDAFLRQKGFDKIFKTSYGKGTSNEQLMLQNGFVEVYDCGQQTWLYKTV